MPLEQAIVLEEALQQTGIDVSLTVFPNAGHAGSAFSNTDNHKTLVKFLDSHLKQ